MNKLIVQHRRGTKDAWEKSLGITPEGDEIKHIPADGELVVERTGEVPKIKIGNGQASYSELPYITDNVQSDIESVNAQLQGIIAGAGEPAIGSWEDEVKNIRYNILGDEAPTAGEAVRSLERDLRSLKGDLNDFIGAQAVDGLEYTPEYELYLTANGTRVGNPVTILAGGGGGGGGPTTVQLMNKMSSTNINAIKSDRIELRASFYEKIEGEQTSVPGTLQVSYTYDNKTTGEYIEFPLTETQRLVSQDETFFVNIAPIASLERPVHIKLTVVGGQTGKTSNTITYTVNLYQGSIEVIGFNSTQVFTGNTELTYRVTGYNVSKTLVLEMDGDPYFYREPIGKVHNETKTVPIELTKLQSGAHNLTVYYVTDQGAPSNKEYFSLLYSDASNTESILGAVLKSPIIDFGDSIEGTYKAYTPGKETTDGVTLSLIGYRNKEEVELYSETLTSIKKETEYSFTLNNYISQLIPTENNTVFIKFSYGQGKETTLELEIRASTNNDYNIYPVTSGLIYSYNASTINNGSKDRDTYSYKYTDKQGTETVITATNVNFNWRANGYIEQDTELPLTISGDARHNINLPLLSASYVDNNRNTIYIDDKGKAAVVSSGRTIEFDLKIYNVTDPTKEIVKCMSSEHSGFVITPTYMCMLSKSGSDIITDEMTGFIKNERDIAYTYIKDNERLRLTIAIEPLGTQQYEDTNGTVIKSQCINLFINGQYAKSFIYDASYDFSTNSTISIGDNSCIVNLYEVKVYNRCLSAEEVLQNYNVSPLALEAKTNRLKFEDVLDDDNQVDYEKAKSKYNCLLITGELAPDKETERPGGLILTRVDSQPGFELMDTNEEGTYVCYNKVQGTSSVKFPLKNYKVYLRKLNGSEVKKVKYSLKGKNGEGKDLSIGESTLCFKADYMSSDHPNTFNANLADTLFPKDTIAQSENPLVQNTIWGFRCLLFYRETEGGPIRFISDGALNNDKGNTKTFGLEVEGDEIIVKAKIGKHSDATCLSDAQIVTTKDDASVTSINFLDAIELVANHENDVFTTNYYYIEGLLSYTMDIEGANKCLKYEDDEEEMHSIYLLDLKDSAGVDYDKSTNCPHIGDYANLTTRQKWEFKNNTEALCTFKTDKFFDKDSGGEYMVPKALESTYPDEKDLKKDFRVTPDYTALQLLFTWVCQRANFWEETDPEARAAKKDIFKSEFTKHFNLEHALIYYLFMEFIGLCDNRAKNMFLRTENLRNNTQLKLVSGENISYDSILSTIINDDDGSVKADIIDWEHSTFTQWITDLYDLDSGFGVENSGYMDIPYYADWDYSLGYDEEGKPKYKFNGHDSVFWLMFEEAFEAEIMAKAQELTRNQSTGALNYDSLYKYHIEGNALLVCSNIVNQDMISKYSDPWIKGYVDGSDNTFKHSSEYKYLQRGSRTYQKLAYIYNRTNMLYSKYKCGQYTSDSINFRAGVNVDQEKTGISLKYSRVIFPGVKYGDGDATTVYQDKKYPDGTSCTITKTGSVGSSDTIYLLGGKSITSIEGIEKFSPYEVKLENAKSLRKLTLSSIDYKNTILTSLTELNNCPLLETLNLAYCKSLTTLDLSKNYLLKEVDIQDSGITTITFASGGVLESINATNTSLTNLSLVDLSKLTSFNLPNLNALTTLRIENISNSAVDGLNLIQQEVTYLDGGVPKTTILMDRLAGLRLCGINSTITDDSLLNILTNDAYMKGKYINDQGVLESSESYPYISGTLYYEGTLDGNIRKQVRSNYADLIVNFREMESTVKFYDLNGLEIKESIITAYDSELSDIPNTDLPSSPVKPNDAEWSYSFIGWSTEPNIVIDITYDSNYENSPEYKLYIENACKDIEGNTSLYPAFTKSKNKYRVTFKTGNETLYSEDVYYGSFIAYDSEEVDNEDLLNSDGSPKKIDPEGITQGAYKFLKWSYDMTNDAIITDTDIKAIFYIDTNTAPYEPVKLDNTYLDYEEDAQGIIVKGLKDISIPHIAELPSTIDNTDIYSIEGFHNTPFEYLGTGASLQVIKDNAFNNNSLLHTIVLDKSITEIGDTVVTNCPELSQIYYNCETAYKKKNGTLVSQNPFLGIGSLGDNINIFIGPDVTGITPYMFSSTSNREDCDLLDFTNANKCTYVNEYGFNKLNPKKIIFNGSLGTIGSYAFGYNDYIKELILPEGISSIGLNAFGYWDKLETVTLPSTFRPSNGNVFQFCPNITSFSLPPYVPNTYPYSFEGGCVINKVSGQLIYSTTQATSESVNRIEGLEALGADCFHSKKHLTSFEIPDNIKVISERSFAYCSNLTTIDLKNVERIDTNAFTNTKLSGTLDFSNKLKTFGSVLFNGTSINQLIIKHNTPIISVNAFYGMTELQKAFIVAEKMGATPDQSGKYQIFAGCNKLSDIYVGWRSDATFPAASGKSYYWGAPNSEVRIHYETKLNPQNGGYIVTSKDENGIDEEATYINV